MNTKSKEFKAHGNAVLAEFMGVDVTDFTSYPEEGRTCFTIHDLEYDSNPEWIWKVVEKIESLTVDGFEEEDADFEDQKYSVQIERNYCQVYDHIEMVAIFSTEASNKMDAVFETCVKFAEWYNENH